jgi:predicted N-acetyltransferase YhbS
MKLLLREEKEQDYFDVLVLTRDSFWKQERVEKMGLGALEHYMVHKARRSIMVKELSLVATIHDRIVGHILYTRGSYIAGNDGQRYDVLCLGPVSVRKDQQNKGIGSILIQESLKKAKELAYPAVLLYGHPNYYPRFGFQDAKVFDVRTEEGENFPAFMALELEEGWFEGVSGRYIMHPLFDEEKEVKNALAFDQAFFQ